MNIILVSPPNPSMVDPRIAPPLGLLMLVSWARHAGAWRTEDFRCVDLNTACHQPDAPVGHLTHDFSLPRCMREVPSGGDVYGVQLASMQMPHGLAVAASLDEREPSALTVCGGSHASAVPDECADSFDVVVTQEGEHAFLSLIDAWRSRSGPLYEQVVAARARRRSHAGPGLVLHGPQVADLDVLPVPARDLLDFGKYTRRVAGAKATNIITTRGCPARCTFCQQDSLWGRGLRMQSTAHILGEVDHIYESLGIRNLLFLDDSLTARKRSEMLSLAHGLGDRGVKWRGWTRANLCARDGEIEVLRAMADGGCQALCIGVEAGTDKVLKAVGKGTTVEQNRTAIRRVKEAGMWARCSIMVGNPEETWEDVEALCRFVEEVQPDDWILSSFVPLPGTPSWDHPDRYGIVIDKEKARRERYRHFFVVGGDEQSGLVHRYENGVGPAQIQARHDYAQERLLRTCPRDRIRVTVGRDGLDPRERVAA